ncbi:MAG: hypothetical protein ACQEUH_11755 [Pseudomonadota bacterium]
MSDVLKNPVVTGVGGVIGGLLVGSLLSLSTIDSKIGASIEDTMEDMAEALAGDEDARSDMTARLAALEEAVSETGSEVATVGEAVSGNAGEVASVGAQIRGDLDERISAIETRIDDMSADLGNEMSQAMSEQTENLRAALQTRPAAAAQPDPEEAAAPVSEAPEALSSELRMTGETRGVGETFVLADGAVRAFVQRFDAEGGTALLSVNRAATPLAVGESVVVPHGGGACRVGLAGVTGDGVRIGSDCDVPAGDAALGAAYLPGELAMLGDGQLRVFVSGIFGDEARLAINGLETLRMRVGEAREVAVGEAGCVVHVNGIRGNSVMLTGDCA